MEEFYKTHKPCKKYKQKMLEGTLIPCRDTGKKLEATLLTEVIIPKQFSGMHVHISCTRPEMTMLDYFLLKHKERIEYESKGAWREAQNNKPKYYSAYKDRLVQKPSNTPEADNFHKNYTV